MANEFIPKGVEIVKQAIIKDNEEKFEEALPLYKQAITYFMTGMKYEKNDTSKAAVRAKITEYLNRAEEIQKFLDAKKNGPPKKEKKAVAAGGANDDEKDPEAAKLAAALSSAIVTETPNVKWSDVAGLEQAKALLKEAVILPIKFPQLFTGKRTPWRGILLYGPPGTGKSYLAKAVATEAGASTFLSVSSSDLVSKFQGESERLVKSLFEIARAKSPAIIFIDEVDSLCSSRSDGENDSARRIKTEFLVQMQGVGKGNDGILVLGATNVPWELDPAIRRRFEKRVYVPLPELEARQIMFKLNIGNTPHELTDADFLKLAQQTDGFSGSDISVVVRDALYEPVRTCQAATHFRAVMHDGKQRYTPCSPTHPEAIEMSIMDLESEQLMPQNVTMRDFLRVMKNAKSSVGPDDLTAQEDWTKQFGQEG